MRNLAMTGCWIAGKSSRVGSACRSRSSSVCETFPGEMFRFQRAALSRAAARGAEHRSQFHLGEAGAAGGRIGGTGASERGAPRTVPALWRASVPGLKNALARLQEIANLSTNEDFVGHMPSKQ